MNNLVLGGVVYSKRGRDNGGYYIVIKIIDDDYVMIADGEVRKIEKPKKKRKIHLKPNGEVLSKIAVKLGNNELVHNAEIRSALRIYNEKAEVKTSV